jgi:hypothetical protein
MRAKEFSKLLAKDFKKADVLADIILSLECLDSIIDDYLQAGHPYCPICLNDCTDGEELHDYDCLFGKVVKALNKQKKQEKKKNE